MIDLGRLDHVVVLDADRRLVRGGGGNFGVVVGAFGEVPRDATAFAHRDAEVMVLAMSKAPAAEAARSERALQDAWADVASHGSGVYLNFQGSASEEDLRAAYPPATYDRLVAVKRRYDPENVFARNHNIAPLADRTASAPTGQDIRG